MQSPGPGAARIIALSEFDNLRSRIDEANDRQIAVTLATDRHGEPLRVSQQLGCGESEFERRQSFFEDVEPDLSRSGHRSLACVALPNTVGRGG